MPVVTSAPRFTDSVDETTLHNVGTIQQPTSGSRLGGNLDGIDTPTLISLWNTAPYLHDGSAMDITEAISAHTGISLTAQQLNELGTYLDELDSITALISGPPAGCTSCIDFLTTTTSSFGTQDNSADVQVLDGGDTIRLANNTWRRTDQTFTITPTTMLEFTFESAQEGEIQGIGFNDNENTGAAASRVFQLWGTQNWAISGYNYSGTGPQNFQIPVGQHYTGTNMHLIFVNDDDAGVGSDSKYTNVRVYDPSQGPAAPVITNPGNQQSTNGSNVTLNVVATDGNGDPLIFTATNLPTGLSISQDGTISGTPTETNSWAVEVSVTDNISGSDSAFFTWTIVDPSACTDCIDFTDFDITSFTSQDEDSDIQSLNNGATIQLSQNTWSRSETTYNITPTTMLEFKFESSQQGEIQGIGFAETEIASAAASRVFQLWGTQNWAIRDFTYDDAGQQVFQIPVGQYYTGTNMYLIFVNDDDAGVGSESRYTDIRVYDPNQVPAAPVITNPGIQSNPIGVALSLDIVATDANNDTLEFSATDLPTGLGIASDGRISGTPSELGTWAVTVTVTDNISGSDSAVFDWSIVEASQCTDCIDFLSATTSSFPNQDASQSFQVLNNGQTFQLLGNTWRRTDQTFTLTPTTMLAFTFESSQEGEIQAIGLSDGDSSGAIRNHVAQLQGTQTFGIQGYDYGGSGPQYYEIPIGQYVSGSDLHLVFVNDDDQNVGSEARYTDVRIFDPGN